VTDHVECFLDAKDRSGEAVNEEVDENGTSIVSLSFSLCSLWQTQPFRDNQAAAVGGCDTDRLMDMNRSNHSTNGRHYNNSIPIEVGHCCQYGELRVR
jgi:hypothetical protein